MSCIIAFSAQCGERYSFSYTFDGAPRGTPGEVLSGIIEGRLAEDGDTIIIEKFIEADLSGINYNLSDSTEMRAADPVNVPKMSLSGDVLDFWVCAKGFDGFYENGGGDCAFGVTGGFLISPYVDVNTAECIQSDELGQCIIWAWAGIPEKTNDYRVGDIPVNDNNWTITKLLPTDIGEIVTPKGEYSEPVLFRFNEDTGRYFVSSLSGSFNLSWQGAYSQASLYALPDMNGNGSSEIGLFGIRSDEGNEGKPQLFIRDSLTGSRVSVLNWVANWSNASIVVLPDITGDDVVEIGLQGEFFEGARPQLVIKNGLTNSYISTASFPAQWAAPQYMTFNDLNQDGTNEIAMFGIATINNKPQIRIVDGAQVETRLFGYNFPDNWTDVQWLNVGDQNNDGLHDWALLGQSKIDGRWQLIIKDGQSPIGALSIYAWPDLTNITFGRFSDFTNDGIQEFALGGFNIEKNRWQLLIKDGQNRNTLLAVIGWANKWDDASIHILNDIDGDNIQDAAIFGKRRQYELAIRLSREDFTVEHIINLGGEWTSKPNLNYVAPGIGEDQVLAAFDYNGESIAITPILSPIPSTLNYQLTIDSVISSQEGTLCNIDDEYVGLEDTMEAELSIDEYLSKATLVIDIEGEGQPVTISGSFDAVTQAIDIEYGIDVFELTVTATTESTIALTGSITTTDTSETGSGQCVTVFDLDVFGSLQ
ncbi:hypothetical protein [Alteromonas marina]|uniref:hypothetical protein n=1 Tax=Alteromonas marina TaxID=203795 RepID=UPI0012EB9227|nr:hypothetical protein [Alteromonas marina]